MSTDTAIGRAVVLACELEVAAAKPGNVTPLHAFPNMSHADFLASAGAIAPVLAEAGARSVGETVLAAVEATWRVTRVNTNLGIVLLLSPLAKAAADSGVGVGAGTDLAGRRRALRDALAAVLQGLDVEDARLAYRAIRMARPGGLSAAAAQDVWSEPTVTLLEAMRLAGSRDAIAAEYAGGFVRTFDLVEPALAEALSRGAGADEAVVEAFLRTLAHVPDTHVARKHGPEAARGASRRAAEALAAGPPGSPARQRAVATLDGWLRDPSRRWNPGATADLVAAALFVHLIVEGETSIAVDEAPRLRDAGVPVAPPA